MTKRQLIELLSSRYEIVMSSEKPELIKINTAKFGIIEFNTKRDRCKVNGVIVSPGEKWINKFLLGDE